jgi:DNA recombination protein RmuC
MNDYCDFEEQVSVSTEDGKLRPDMIVKLPGNRRVIVDSKVPLAAYMQAFETTEEKERNTLLAKHAAAVKEHLKQLSTKAYWSQFRDTPDFVVLYMQIESSFGAALELEKELIQEGINNRIIFATPTTIITLLKTVAYSWQQEKISENAQKIQEAGVELYNRINTLIEHIGRVGDNLKTAVDNYNKAVGSIESRFIPQVKKLKELGAAQQDKEIAELNPLDRTVRNLPDGG